MTHLSIYKNVLVVGAGYVGLSSATLISSMCNVTVVDIDTTRVIAINSRISPISDTEIQSYWSDRKLNLAAALPDEVDYAEFDLILLCLPTNYEPRLNKFDTKILDETILKISQTSFEGTVVIKSTIPIGYTQKQQEKYNRLSIFYSPEFLREGKALYDNLYPSRIIVGDLTNEGSNYADFMHSLCKKRVVPKLQMTSTEAECVKLCSNSYLAMRVAFFNEVDNFALSLGMESTKLIDGICLDPRIGAVYNNPSFGYGGYCLPKDVKQLQATLKDANIESPIVESIHASNENRLKHLCKHICDSGHTNIGIYSLSMKKNSDNSREAAIVNLGKELIENGKNVFFVDSAYDEDVYGFVRLDNVQLLANKCSIILSNRMEPELEALDPKIIFTRDIYNEN